MSLLGFIIVLNILNLKQSLKWKNYENINTNKILLLIILLLYKRKPNTILTKELRLKGISYLFILLYLYSVPGKETKELKRFKFSDEDNKNKLKFKQKIKGIITYINLYSLM